MIRRGQLVTDIFFHETSDRKPIQPSISTPPARISDGLPANSHRSLARSPVLTQPLTKPRIFIPDYMYVEDQVGYKSGAYLTSTSISDYECNKESKCRNEQFCSILRAEMDVMTTGAR